MTMYDSKNKQNYFSHLGLKQDNINITFFYFFIAAATTCILGYLLEFLTDFKEKYVVFVNGFYLSIKSLLRMSLFYPMIWGQKPDTHTLNT